MLITLGRLRQIISETSAQPRPPSGFISAVQSSVVDRLRADPDFASMKVDKAYWRGDHAAVRIFPTGAFEGVVYNIYPPQANGQCVVEVSSAYDEGKQGVHFKATMTRLMRAIRQHFVSHMIEHDV